MTSLRDRAVTGSAAVPPIHPPKVEVFDLVDRTNTDPKGFVRPVDEFRVEPFGLYMARPLVDHPRVSYVESWLLPGLDLRVSDWWFRPGIQPDQDFYLDLVQISPGPERWRSRDHYLDVVVNTGRDLEVLDTDELLAAVGTGLLDWDTAHHALETTYHVVDGIARSGYDLHRWFAGLGLPLTWKRRSPL